MASPSSASLTTRWEIKTGGQRRRAEWAREQRQEQGEGGKDSKGVCMQSGSVYGTELKGSYRNEGIQTGEARREDPDLKSNQFFKSNTWPNTDCCTLLQRCYMRHLSANYWVRPPYELNTNAGQAHTYHGVISKNELTDSSLWLSPK